MKGEPNSDRVDRASATETVDSGSIPGRMKPKTIKIGIHSFPARRPAIRDSVKPPLCVVPRWQLDRKVLRCRLVTW